MNSIEEFLTTYISPSESLNKTTAVRYAHVSSGVISTGTMSDVYDVSVSSLVEMYKWIVGKLITGIDMWKTLVKLGYKLVPGLPVLSTGVYATWIRKPGMGLLVL